MRAPAISPVGHLGRLTCILAAALLAAAVMAIPAKADEPSGTDGADEAAVAAESTDDISGAESSVASAAATAAGSESADAPTLAGYLSGGMLRVSADVALVDGDDEAVEPVVGSFTVDGLTYAIVEEGEVALVAVSPRTLAGGLVGGSDVSPDGSVAVGSSGADGEGRGIGSGVPTSPRPQPSPSAEAAGSGGLDDGSMASELVGAGDEGAGLGADGAEGLAAPGPEADSDDEGPGGPATLTLPDAVSYDGINYSLATIGPRALAGCDAATVVLPASVETVDQAAFEGSPVASVEVADGNPHLSSFDGMLFDAGLTRLLLVPEGKQGAARIPKEAEVVDPSCFSHSAGVSSIDVEAGSAAYSSRNGCLYDASGETLLRVPAGAIDVQIADGCITVAAGSMEDCDSLVVIRTVPTVTEVSSDARSASPGNQAGGWHGTPLEGLFSSSPPLERTDDVVVAIPPGSGEKTWEDAGFKLDASGLDQRSQLASQDLTKEANIGVDIVCDPGSTVPIVLAGSTNWAFNHTTPYYYSSSWWSSHVDVDEITAIVRTENGNATISHQNKSATFSFARTAGYTYQTIEYTYTPYITPLGQQAKRWCLKFKFSRNTYKLEYDSNAGTDAVSGIPAATTYEYGLKTKIPASRPTRLGYSFAGWNTQADGEGSSYASAEEAVLGPEHTTLYAQWAPIVCKVTLDNTHHKDSQAVTEISIVYVKYGTGIYLDEACTRPWSGGRTLPVPSRPGYGFQAFSTTQTYDGRITNDSGTFYREDYTRLFGNRTSYTLFAIWASNDVYTITIDLSPPATNCEDGTTPEDGVGSVLRTGTERFYQWTGRGFYTVPNPKDTDAAVTSITPPARKGYTFLGLSGTKTGGTWFTNESGLLIHHDGALLPGTPPKAMENDLFTQNQTIFARWAGSALRFELDNCATDLTQKSDPEAIWVKYNDGDYGSGKFADEALTTALNKMAKLPKRTGYTFKGYRTGADGGGTLVIDADGEFRSYFTNTRWPGGGRFYADWKENACSWDLKLVDESHSKIRLDSFSYVVPGSLEVGGRYPARRLSWDGYAGTFSGNSAGGYAVSIKGTNYGEGGAIEPAAGYEFAGWSFDGDEPEDAEPAPARGGTWDEGNRTFYAHVEPRTYEVAFDRNHGGGTADDPNKGQPGVVTATFGSPMPEVPASVGWPERPGYAFMGWFDGYGWDAGSPMYYRPVLGPGGEELLESARDWDRHDWNEREGATELEQLRAGWDANAYQVAFDPAGGAWDDAAAGKAVSAAFDQDVTLAAAPKRSGYLFAGWEATGPDGAAYSFDAGATLAGGKLKAAEGDEPAVPVSYGERAVEGQEPAATATFTAKWVADLRVDVPIAVDLDLTVDWEQGRVVASGPDGSEHATGEFRSWSSGEVQVAAFGQEAATAMGHRQSALGLFASGDEAKAANLSKVSLALSADADGAQRLSFPLSGLYELPADRPPHDAMASPQDLAPLNLVVPPASSVSSPGTLRVRYGIECAADLPLSDVAIDERPRPILKLVYEVGLA